MSEMLAPSATIGHADVRWVKTRNVLIEQMSFARRPRADNCRLRVGGIARASVAGHLGRSREEPA
jgi:hypothetical protein